jgi:predicted lipoprotein with Yx(FWY)xxD motif
MKAHHIGGLVLAGALALAACSTGAQVAGKTNGYGGAGGASPPTSASPPVTVKTAASKLGTILVDSQGRTLYAFTNDANGMSTCNGACADAWPPVAAMTNNMVGGGVDPALVSMVARADHTSQLKIGKWPVYLFAGDGAPGDVNGQGSGGTWFVLAPNGSLIKT